MCENCILDDNYESKVMPKSHLSGISPVIDVEPYNAFNVFNVNCCYHCCLCIYWH